MYGDLCEQIFITSESQIVKYKQSMYNHTKVVTGQKCRPPPSSASLCVWVLLSRELDPLNDCRYCNTVYSG